MFVDRVTIELQAGSGGDGCRSFRRERYVPRGGPDGGDGGHGGHIILVAEAGIDSLMSISHRKRWKSDSGKNGQGANRHGRRGEDLVLRVPPGTLVIDAEDDFVLKDLKEPGDQVVAARGGKGGKGNTHFKSSTNRAPRQASGGEIGEIRKVKLELKVIADVGLIGCPNAGKSTLLSRLSKARPEIADYPFTTKYPNLGRVQIDMDTSFVLADIPGLIEGAHAGVGLGHEFLRHIQRAGILVHLVEPCPMDGTDPLENYASIRDELTRFDKELGERPEIVAVTKAELPVAEEVHAALVEKLAFREDEQGDEEVTRPLLISAVTGQGLNQLTAAIAERLNARATT